MQDLGRLCAAHLAALATTGSAHPTLTLQDSIVLVLPSGQGYAPNDAAVPHTPAAPGSFRSTYSFLLSEIWVFANGESPLPGAVKLRGIANGVERCVSKGYLDKPKIRGWH